MSTLDAWGEAGTKYHIEEETLSFYEKQSDVDVKPFEECSIEDARTMAKQMIDNHCGTTEFKGSVTEHVVPSVHSDGIPVTVYKDNSCPDTAPILVYFHGGGFIVGTGAGYVVPCKILARDTPCIVVNVEYRLAPEHRFPAQFDDAECVTRWVTVNKTLIGGSDVSRVGVSGDSAGGNLAASVCHYVKVDFQVLVYPITDQRLGQPSISEFESTPGLNHKTMEWLLKLSESSPEQRSDPRFSPLLQEDCSRLPPAIFIIAELDPLRDCCNEYRDKLSSAGVVTECVFFKGIPHGFFHLYGHYRKYCETSYAAITAFIRKHS